MYNNWVYQEIILFFLKLIINKDKLKPYKISTDKTAFQRTQLKQLIAEKDAHNSLHPDDQIQIEYFSGIPKLVKCTNNNVNNNFNSNKISTIKKKIIYIFQ